MTDSPSSSERTRQALKDFLEFGRSAQRLVARGRDAYDADEMLRLAAEAVVHRIGESVSRLDAAFTEGHPEIPWRRMKGMRNVVAHDYGAVDPQIVWNALASELPEVMWQVERIKGEVPLE